MFLEGVIRRMDTQFVEPTFDEGFDYIWHYGPETNELTCKGKEVK